MSDLAWTYTFLCGSAFAAGVMNSVAGGGTLLTFPALTGVVPPAVANGTSTVALLPGSFAGALGYRRGVGGGRHRVRAGGVLLRPAIRVNGAFGGRVHFSPKGWHNLARGVPG